MNFAAASEATPSFGWNPSGSVRQPGPGFRSEHIRRHDSPSTERKPPLQVHSEGDQYMRATNVQNAVLPTLGRRGFGYPGGVSGWIFSASTPLSSYPSLDSANATRCGADSGEREHLAKSENTLLKARTPCEKREHLAKSEN
eukprot:1190409-Prorocentrum_minimum.AAC.1